MQQKFVVSHDGHEMGPYTEAEIRQLVHSNQIFPVDYLFDESVEDWVMINQRFNLEMSQNETTPDSASEKPDGPPPQDVVIRRTTPKPVSKLEPVLKSEPVSPARELPVDVPTAKNIPQSSGPRKVQFQDGVGSINLKQLKAGTVQLKLKSFNGLKTENDLQLRIQAGPAHKIMMLAPDSAKAGVEFALELKALDAFDNITPDFNASLSVVWTGAQPETRSTQFRSGLARVTFKPTKAEAVQLTVKDDQNRNLQLPSPKTITVHPGQPAKLVFEGPKEMTAGTEVELKVKALDSFGNVVTDFKGDLDLEVETKAS